MYIYNVSIKLLPEIETEWIDWMTNEHIQEVMDTGMFDGYSLLELMDPVDEDGKTYIAQYSTDSEARYERYIAEFAPLLREKGYAKFGNRFIAFRSIMRHV